MRSPQAFRSLHPDLLGDVACRAELRAAALDLSSKQTHFNSLLRQKRLLSPLSASPPRSALLGHPSPRGELVLRGEHRSFLAQQLIITPPDCKENWLLGKEQVCGGRFFNLFLPCSV